MDANAYACILTSYGVGGEWEQALACTCVRAHERFSCLVDRLPRMFIIFFLPKDSPPELTPPTPNKQTVLGRLEDGSEAQAPRQGVPSLCNYNAAMMAVARAGRLDEVRSVFARLRARGLKPDAFTYAAAIVGCTKSGNAGEARRLFEEARATRGLSPTMEVYGTMLDAYSKVGRWVGGGRKEERT